MLIDNAVEYKHNTRQIEVLDAIMGSGKTYCNVRIWRGA